ncbi:MAG: DUF4271 domain-containing protein [Bacteroidota bacterium]
MGRRLFGYCIYIACFLMLPLLCWAETTPGNSSDDTQAHAEKNYYIVRDLQNDWQVYDQKYNAYVPYLQEKHTNVYSASILVDLPAYQGYELLFYTDKEIYLFIDAALQKRIKPATWAVVRMDSLRDIYKNSAGQPTSLFLTFYSPVGALPLPTVFIGHPKSIQEVATADTALLPLSRQKGEFKYFVIIASLFILACFAFLFNLHSTAFVKFYTIRGLFTTSYRDGAPQVGKPLNGINLLFLLNHGFLLALLYMLIREGSQHLRFPDQLLQTQENLSGYLMKFFVIGLSIFLLILLKFLGTYILGNLFRLDKLIDVHFFEFIHFSKVFYTLVVPVLLVVYTSYPSFIDFANNLCIMLIIGFSLLRILLISFRLNKLAPHRNLYLFSYLCVTELVPLLTGIKILL